MCLAYNLKTMYIFKVMSERDDFYNSLPYSGILRAWKDILDHGDIGDAVAYWTEHNELDVNAYIKRSQGQGQGQGQQWVPVVYYCCLKSEWAAMTQHLMMTGADIDRLPDADRYDYLPFVCNSLYLIAIAKKTKHRPYTMSSVLVRSINNRLNGGDSRRLTHLMQLGLLTESSISHVIKMSRDVILDKLQSMVKYLTYVYNVRAPSGNLNVKTETGDTINKFMSTAKFLIAHGAPCTVEAVNYCIEYYLHEFIPVLIRYVGSGSGSGADVEEPVYHTQKNSTLTAVLRPLLNDHRYVETCKVCSAIPDEDVFQYNIGC